MFWVARFCAAGSAVTLAALLARRFGENLGGMILAVPFVIGTGLLFAMADGKVAFRDTATGVLWGLLPLLSFSLAVLVVSRQHSTVTALLCGLLVWLAVAGVVFWLR